MEVRVTAPLANGETYEVLIPFAPDHYAYGNPEEMKQVAISMVQGKLNAGLGVDAPSAEQIRAVVVKG